VLEAENGEQALRIAEEHPGAIHVLVTDVMMPGINGKELADRLAVSRPDTKMIFMSGRAAEVISDAGVLIPVDSFLAKPFTVERLLNKVRERLEYRSPFSRPR
jgi:DNA-binding response OmpR family regulator